VGEGYSFYILIYHFAFCRPVLLGEPCSFGAGDLIFEFSICNNTNFLTPLPNWLPNLLTLNLKQEV